MKQIVTGLRPEKKIEVESVDRIVPFFLQVEERERKRKNKKNLYRLKVFFFFCSKYPCPYHRRLCGKTG